MDWSVAAMLVAATCAAGIKPAAAAVDLSASVTVGAEYNSNALQLSRAELPPDAASGNPQRDDLAKRVSVNVGAETRGTGPLQLQLDASYSYAIYDRRDTLDQGVYGVGGTLEWKPGQVFDVSLSASQTRTPVELADFVDVQARQQTTREVEGTVRVRVTPRWQVGLAPSWQQSDLPQPAGPNYELRETGGTVSLAYLGVGALVPGVSVRESRGRYSGIENATRYEQRSAQGTLNYRLSGFSNFSLAAGYTERATHLVEPSTNPFVLANEGTTPAFTGSLTVQRQLSMKTGLSLSAFRDFEQFDAGVNTTVGTGFSAGVSWAPTPRLSTTFDTRFAWSTIEGIQLTSTVDERKDLVRTYSVGITYAATRRVSLRSYVTRSTRDSTARSALYNGTTAGLELTATFD